MNRRDLFKCVIAGLVLPFSAIAEPEPSRAARIGTQRRPIHKFLIGYSWDVIAQKPYGGIKWYVIETQTYDEGYPIFTSMEVTATADYIKNLTTDRVLKCRTDELKAHVESISSFPCHTPSYYAFCAERDRMYRKFT